MDNKYTSYIVEYDKYLDLVQQNIIKLLPDVDGLARVLRESEIYSLSAGGKRIRPVLVLAACEICGGKVQDAIAAACALEYIHTFSLIHDDLPAMDDDDLRRGKATNHKVYGEAIAILAGDALVLNAAEILVKDAIGTSDETLRLGKLKAMDIITSLAGNDGMIVGQVVDIESEALLLNQSNAEDTENPILQADYIKRLDFIHRNKTGALIAAAVLAGGLVAGADDMQLDALRQYAEAIGLGFQIKDDLLDIESTTEELGKPTGSDEKNAKLTYPSLYGIAASYRKLEELTFAAEKALDVFGERAAFLRDFALGMQVRKN
ncbi:MAG: polyprenyl synthetase family protein [Clostridiales Family XIII bacterium]|nr:polyprenyl synthetase family protein [Clostridiales Family XIII bacterium]